MSRSSDPFSTRAIRDSLPGLSISSSTTKSSNQSSHLSPYQSLSKPRRNPSPASSSSSRSSANYTLEPPGYNYTPREPEPMPYNSSSRTKSSNSGKYLPVTVHNKSSYPTDDFQRTKDLDGRYIDGKKMSEKERELRRRAAERERSLR